MYIEYIQYILGKIVLPEKSAMVEEIKSWVEWWGVILLLIYLRPLL